MAMTRGDVEIKTSTQGGFMKGLKRSLGGESFFVNDFTSARGGLVAVAPALPGDMALAAMTASDTLLVQSGSWIASDPAIDVDAKWGGGKTFFSGEGLVLLRCTGVGDILLSAYGAIRFTQLAAGESMTLDTGHVVAFDTTVRWDVRKVSGMFTSLISGEGLVCEFTGTGNVWLQTRSSSDLVGWIEARLPKARS